PLHGGANEKALEMILSIGSPENVEGYVKQVLASKGRIMGFGHRVYKSYDPRAAIFRRYLESLSQHRGDRSFLDITKKLEEVVRRELAGKPIFPNIDLYSGAVFHMLGLSKRVFTPLFAAARTVGWAAHVLEYWRDNRLIRPRATYVGPPIRRYIPVHQR
ncbi:MAG: citrate/2-methylcitrate synthase, partial [Nitrososphaerota archaeon]